MKAVVIVSANAEWKIVRKLYPHLSFRVSPFGEYAQVALAGAELIFFHGGWGKISAAASAQYAIDHFKPDLLVNLGTCGGFAGRIEIGTVILAERTLVYDIIEQMDDAEEAIRFYASSLDLSWLPSILPYPAWRGLLLSADRDIAADDIPMLIQRYDAVAADWESGALAWVAQKNHVRVLILRAVSDLVSGDGGEAYKNIGLFHERTEAVMMKLIGQLPDWLEEISLP